VRALEEDKVMVRGITSDNGEVKKVLVNGRPARLAGGARGEWEVVLEGVPAGEWTVSAHAEDAAGNVEKVPHVVRAAGRAGRRAAAGKEGPREKTRPPAVKVTVDVSDVPDLADRGKEAKALAEKWHPLIADLLPSDGFTPPGEIKIVFKKGMRGVACTQGATIVIASRWVRDHPDDYGMVIHELTHTVQYYPRPNRGAGWLVEGIADYVRFYHYEPQTKLTLDPRKASYRDGYRTAAMFLAWIEKNRDRGIVRKLNEALRKGEYKEELFITWTSKSLDELWEAFAASVERKP
jgi:hypothetical protein